MITQDSSIENNGAAIQKPKFNIVLRFLAQLFSYIFHPLFVPVYVYWFIAFVHPGYFVGFSTEGKQKLMVLIIINAVLFPAITVALLRGLKFIDSIFLKTQKDRIIPYIASMTFFFWTYYVLREQHHIPRVLVSFFFGVFISTAAALISNIYFKISMHAIGMGGVLGLFTAIVLAGSMLMTGPLTIALLIAGMVCTSRLMISDHSQKEVYMGLLVGFVCQLVGVVVVLT